MSQDLVYWVKNENWTLNAVNLLLLPGMSTSGSTEPNGALLTDTFTKDEYCFIDVSNELIVAGNPVEYNNVERSLSVTSSYRGKVVAEVTMGAGAKLSLVSQSGDSRSDVTMIDESFSDDKINIIGSANYHISRTSYSDTYVQSGIYESTPIYSPEGDFTIDSDLCGNITNTHTVFLTGHANKDHSDVVDNTNGNTISSTALNSQKMEVYNNFDGKITASLDVSLTGGKTANVNNNTISVQGLWVKEGDFVCDGFFGYDGKGTITVTTPQVGLFADISLAEATAVAQKCLTAAQWNELSENDKANYDYMENVNLDYPVGKSGSYYVQKSDKAIGLSEYNDLSGDAKNDYGWVLTSDGSGSASATGDTVKSYGIRADNGNVTMKKDFSASINTQLSNVTVVAAASGDNVSALFNVELGAYGIYAKNFSVSGKFDGNISVLSDNTSISATGSTTKTESTAHIAFSGLYMESDITIGSFLEGSFTTTWGEYSISSNQTLLFTEGKTSIFGIYAGGTLSVGDGRGLIQSNINVTQTAVSNSPLAHIYGIKVDTLKAESLGATITVNANQTSAVGVSVSTFQNASDSVFNEIISSFDIIGDITATSTTGKAVAIESEKALNLRIASKIDAKTYSILSGTIKETGGKSVLDFADHIELAAGADVTGDIYIGSGTNSVTIDSNARMHDKIDTEGGTLNLTFTLNRYGILRYDEIPDNLFESDLIFEGDITTAVGTTVLVDLNSAADETYKLMKASTGVQSLSLVYQGTIKSLSLEGGYNTTDIGNLTVTGETDTVGDFITVTVSHKDPQTLDDFAAQSVYIDLDKTNNKVICTISNDVDRNMSLYAGKTLFLTYKDSNGTHIEKNSSLDSTTGVVTFDIEDVASISDVQAVISNDAEYNKRNAWLNTVSLTGSTDAETGVFRLDWKFSAATPITSTYMYELEYCVMKNGKTDWTNSTLVTMDYVSSFYELANLSEGDQVRARLRLVKKGSSKGYTVGEWSAYQDFEVSSKEFASIPVVDGLNDELSISYPNAIRRLTWNDMRGQLEAGLDHYEVQYFWAIDSNSNVINDLTESELKDVWGDKEGKEAKGYFIRGDETIYVTVYNRSVTTNTYILANLDVNNAYYWRVRAVSTEDNGDWSDTKTFSIVTDDLIAPVENPNGTGIKIYDTFDYDNQTLTFKWTGEIAQDETNTPVDYLLYVTAENSGIEQVYQSVRTPNPDNPNDNDYTVTISGYPLNQKFTYYLKARDEAANLSEKLRSSSTTGDKTAPTGLGISVSGKDYETNTSGGKDFIVSFNFTEATDSASGIASYQLAYKKNDTWVTVKEWSADNMVTTYTAQGIDTRDIPTLSDYTCPTYWKLTVTDKAGNSASEETSAVAEQPGEIVLVDNGWSVTVTTSEVKFVWSAATSNPYPLESYTVYYALPSSEEWTIAGSTDAETKTLTINASILEPTTTYKWAVKATDTKNFNSGIVTAASTFTTLDVPQELTISLSANPYYSGSNFWSDFSWSITSGSKTGPYELQRATVGSTNFTTIVTTENTTYSYQPGGSFQYRIKATDEVSGKTVYSSTVKALADQTAPLFQGTDASYESDTTGYTFTWSQAEDPQKADEGCSGMKQYKLQFSTDSSFTNTITLETGSTNTSYLLTKEEMKKQGISSGTYYWRVIAEDNAKNESSALTGSGSIEVDLQGPTNGILTTLDKPTISVTYNWLTPEDTVPYDAPRVRDPRTISVKFDVSDNTYTDGQHGRYDSSGKYDCFTYEIATDSAFSNIVYSTAKDYYEGSATEPTALGHNTLTLSTSNNGIGRLAGYGKNQVFYWRIRAIDTVGNYADDYEYGTPFTLSDPDYEYDDGTYAPIQDLYTKPTTPTGLTVAKYAGDDEDQIGFNAYTFRWTPSSDAFGIDHYEIMGKNTSTKEVRYVYVDASLIKDSLKIVAKKVAGFTAGDYQFKIRAYDGSGKVSDWSDPVSVSIYSAARTSEVEDGFTSDSAITLDNESIEPTSAYTVNYTLPSQYLGTSANYNEIWYKLGGASSGDNHIYTNGLLNFKFTNVNSKLKITLYSRSKGAVKSFTVSKAQGGISNFIYNYSQFSDLVYIQVQNMNKKTYNVTFNMDVDLEYFPTADADLGPNSFEAAAIYGDKYLGSTGTTSISEWVGMNDPADYWMIVGGSKGSDPNTGFLKKGITVSGVQAKLKLSLYQKESDGSYRMLSSKTISKDSTVFANTMVDKYYYVVVESGDNGAGKQNSNYTLTVNETYYPNNHDSQYDPTLIELGEKQAYEWVGYGDTKNYYKFTVTEDDGDGVFSVNLRTYSAKVTASLYNVANDGSISLISKQVNVKGNKTNIFAKSTPCLEAGKNYMVIVDAGTVTKASQNTYFDIMVTETKTFKNKQEANQYNSFDAAFELPAIGIPVNGWVGFNDTENYYKFQYTATTIGKIRPKVKAASGSKIVSVFYDSYYNEVKEKQMVVGETYYLKVYAKDEKKYYDNDFTVTMQYCK